jgi:hypothetical protein
VKGDETMLIAVRVNLDHFIRDLMAGDPVVWTIVAGVVFFTALSAYRKYRAGKTANATFAG